MGCEKTVDPQREKVCFMCGKKKTRKQIMLRIAHVFYACREHPRIKEMHENFYGKVMTERVK